MNKEKLIIIGAGGQGNVIADMALKMGDWKEIAFLDDYKKDTVFGLNIIGTTSELEKYVESYDIFVAIGNNDKRKELHLHLEALGASIPTIIHPASIIGSFVNIGNGTAIMAGAVINCNTEIGKGCIINTGSTIDHDNVIEDYVHISPGVHLAGSVKVGVASWLGIGSVVCNNVSISSGTIIGAGGVVIKDISEQGTYVGVPVMRLLSSSYKSI